MRNWNMLPWLLSQIFSNRLPDYLWGIETRLDYRNPGVHRTCFQTTYEELKLPISVSLVSPPEGFQTTYEELKPGGDMPLDGKRQLPDYLWGIETSSSACSQRISFQLPDYLWGIETTKIWTGRDIRCRASRLPMRNWNSLPRRESVACRPGFQTTYEELKRFFQLGIDNLCRFQTTYEELKLFCTFEEWGNHFFGFQTTYEELKPTNSLCRFPLISLPDYLWGIETLSFQTPSSFLKKASRLPMRNWNVRVAHHFQQALSLPDYLWGIETLPNNYVHSVKILRFQTTYEELKLFNDSIFVYRFRFQTTYEELKLPAESFGRVGNVYCFQTTYEELKHKSNILLDMEFSASRLPMRNWNGQAAEITFSNKKLPDYLWGIETMLIRKSGNL